MDGGADPAPIAYRVTKAVLTPALRAAFPVRVEGAGHVPEVGPVVLAANHRSFMDSIFLAAAVSRPVSFLAKAEYFERRRSAWAFRATGQIPLRRGSPSGARAAMEAALGLLSRGGVVGVYPEGTRSRDGALHRGRLGPMRLATASGAPIVPVGLVGTDAVQMPGEMLPHLRRPVTVRFGAPLRIGPATTAPARTVMRETTDQLMHEIALLCGQVYDNAPVLGGS